jgi:hypothetical protein
MQNSSKGTGTRWGLLFSFVVLALVAAVAVVPTQFEWEASGQGKGLHERTVSHVEGLENYDIRENQKSPEVEEALLKYRDTAGKTASFVADVREGFVRGEESLKTRVPTLAIEYNTDIRIPEVIGPDVKQGVNFLTGPATGSRVDMLRNFAKQNSELIGVNDEQVNQLKVLSDYTNPDGVLSFVHLEQQIDGVPVFRGEIKAGFTKDNEIIRVINNLAPGVEYNSVSKNFGEPLQAVNHAARHINVDVSTLDLTVNETASDSNRTVFGRGDWATTAERMYFPTEPGIVVPAHRVLIWQPVNAFYVIVDANTGTMLWRKNITEDQTQAATYQVYRNSNAMIDVADSPAPLTPGPIDPALGTQGSLLTRANVTRIGNEAPYTFNNNGWITDGANVTDGNFNEAGLDRDGTQGVDAPFPGDTACPGAGCRVFTSTWNPPPGNPAPGDAPLTAQAQRGAVIQMFYAMNWYQSEMYRLGFTEQAFNFQQDNFGRGGTGGDRVASEGQDSSGTNNANFSTPADGGRGRMQMFIFTGPDPDRDGTSDVDIIIHEVTHGLSNRLHGNASGLSTNMARGMGEGWSDFYAHAMLSEPSDPANGVYTTGGYNTLAITSGFTGNYYYGIRRYPKAPLQFTGGANNKPHNAYRFSDINAGCATRFTNADFAFARGPIGSATCDQVHNTGEIWSSILWEVRHRMITRLGWAEGNRKTLQWVTDGMKLAPLGPTLVTERNAILAAVQASGTAADLGDFWAGFAARGLGFSAQVISASPANVVDGFDLPQLGSGGSAEVTSGNNLIEPNECNTLNIPLSNNSAEAATGITAVLSTNTPGVTISQPNSAYPDIPAGGSGVMNTTAYQVSTADTLACFTNINLTLTVTYSGGGGGSPGQFQYSLPVGQASDNYGLVSTTGPAPGNPANRTLVAGSQADDAAAAITLPAGWTSSVYDTAVTSLSASTNGILQVNGTAPTTFSNTALPHITAPTGPRLFPYWDDLNSATTRMPNGGIYTETLGSAPNRQLVIEWRTQHFSNAGADGITTNFAVVLNEGSSAFSYHYTLTGTGGTVVNANGASATTGVQFTNSGTRLTQNSFNQAVIMPGMRIDGTLPPGVCNQGPGGCGAVPSGNGRADFDGDGKTDVSVFRGSEGNWYLNRSTAGFQVLNWGISTDILAPADYDGDGKTDTAIFRGTEAEGATDFYILNSNGFTFSGYAWGTVGDQPVVADYDGDGKADVGIYRPSNGTWYIILSSNGANVIVNNPGTTPVPADYTGDGKADGVIFTDGLWVGTSSTGDPINIPWGQAGDIATPGDFDGDGKVDQAVFRPSTGVWYIRRSSDGQPSIVPFGTTGDIPVVGDYDGDGKDDIAIYRNGQWWINNSGGGVTIANFGISTDKPAPASANP